MADAHAHLESYEPEALAEAVERARAQGVGTIIATGITVRSSAKTVEIAARFPGMRAAVGIHPFHVLRLAGEVAAIREMASNECVVAIGEIGLDFKRNPETRAAQLDLFDRELEIAATLGLPVIVHSKWAQKETLAALRKSGIAGASVMVQGFMDETGPLQGWLDFGCYISVGSNILRPGTGAVLDAAKEVPSDKLLIETDALLRRTVKEGLELATLRPIAEKVAQVRNTSLDDLARTTTANLKKAFRLNDGRRRGFTDGKPV